MIYEQLIFLFLLILLIQIITLLAFLTIFIVGGSDDYE